MFKKVITGIAFAAGLLAADAAFAQAPPTVKLCVQNGATCIPVNSSTPLPVNASVSASITGFPGSAQTTGTPIAVTTGGVTGTLPAGTEVVASNVGATNTAFCKLGASATTSDQPIPPNSWFGFTVGSNTQLTCITSTSTTTVNMVGGSGLPTGSGGGGGGGGGGAVFGPTAVGSAAANPPVLMGGTANAGATGTVQVAKVDSGGGLFFNGLQGGSVLSATNGWYTNILQNNAALTATAALPVTISQNNTALGTPAPYGSTPTGNALSVNAFVTGATGTALGTAVSGITGSPTLGTAYSSEPTKCTTADTCWPMVDLVGKQVTSPYANRENYLTCAATYTASGAATCTGMAAQGAGVKIYITDISCTRNDAGTTAATMTTNAQDSTATNNFTFDMPNNGGGGGYTKSFNVPLVVAANTAFTFNPGSSITSIHCGATGYKGY